MRRPSSPANRTPREKERKVVGLAHDNPSLGARRLAELCIRLYGICISHQTVLAILGRWHSRTFAEVVIDRLHLIRHRLLKLSVFFGAIRQKLRLPSRNPGQVAPPKGWRRMTSEVELAVVRLHVERLDAPLHEIRDLINARFGTNFATRTIGGAILRNKKLIDRLLGRRPRSITTSRPGELWGIDLTEVRVLFFFRVQVFGVIDYFGSRLIALQPLRAATTEQIIASLDKAFERCGRPQRIISDRGRVFTEHTFQAFLKGEGVVHTLTRPGHPWTNGRIERLFLTFKTTLAACYFVISGERQLSTICAEFVVYYSEARPHTSWGGLTPDEVYHGRPKAMRATPTSLFGGRLKWYRFAY